MVQGTFNFQDDTRMSVSAYQEPINYSDEYFGEPLTSSLRLDSQLVPIRFGTDITLDAISFPQEISLHEMEVVCAGIDHIHKSVLVYGNVTGSMVTGVGDN